jgi:uncharacterized protein YuzE
MNIAYDKRADAFYVRLIPNRIEPGGAVETVVVTHEGEELSVHIDLDESSRPIGIEIEILDVMRRGLEGDRVTVEPVSDRAVKAAEAAA